MIIRPSNPGPSQPSNTIDVPRQTSFHVPVGTYSSTIRSVRKAQRQSFNSGMSLIRILFAINVPEANIDYLAKIDLKQDLNEGSDLWNVLCRLLGRTQLQELSGGQFDLDSLVETSCDIEIDHIRNRAEDYDFPLVVITNIQPAGTLIRPEIKEGN